MCNPRQVRVRATHVIAEAWDQEVRRQVTLHGRALGQARVREPLGASVGGPVLAALDRVLDGLDGWQPTPDGYRHDVEGGYVHYHADTRELEIVAESFDDVHASGQAQTQVSGLLEEALEVEGVGHYYDDGWGGRTEQAARRDAERQAEQGREAAAAQRLARARQDLEAQAEDGVRSRAEAAARHALAATTATRSAALRDDAAARLAEVGVQARTLFHQALARSYRDAILAYAHSRRAQGIRCSETDGVVDIEFELDA